MVESVIVFDCDDTHIALMIGDHRLATVETVKKTRPVCHVVRSKWWWWWYDSDSARAAI